MDSLIISEKVSKITASENVYEANIVDPDQTGPTGAV